MATVTFGGGITNMVGSHSGNTFARNKGGAYVKARVPGVKPNSNLQLARRTVIGQVSKYWSNNLSDAQRTAWTIYAQSHPVINRVGAPIILSGQQMFCKLSAQVIDNGNPIINTPPGAVAVGTPTSLTISGVSGSGGSVAVSNIVAGATITDFIWLWVSPPLSPGQSFISSQLRRLPGVLACNTGVSLTTPYTDIFGAFPSGPGQKIIGRIQVVEEFTGLTSAMLQAFGYWT